MRADESRGHLDLEKAALEVVEWGRAHDEASAAPQAAGDDAGQQETLHQELTLHQGSGSRAWKLNDFRAIAIKRARP